MSRIKEFDNKVQKFISMRRNTSLTHVMISLTSIGSAPLGLIILIFIYYLGSFTLVLTILLGASIAIGTVQIIKYFSSRSRPENPVIEAFTSSFPSGHSASVFNLAVILSSFYPQLTVFSLALAVAVAFSRVYLGEHFISDILVGSTIGIAAALTALTII